MLSFGALSLFTPWSLAALAVLPAIWWLMRLTPPLPRRERFPPAALLFGLVGHQRSPESFPWWLLLLRALIAVLLVLAAARPVYNPQADLPASGPVVAVVDDGWAAAADWPARQAALADLIAQAERDDRAVALVTTAPQASPEPPRLMTANEARDAVRALQPKPWPGDRARAVAALGSGGLDLDTAGRVVWLSDGLERDGRGTALADAVDGLQRLGPVTVIEPPAGNVPITVLPPEREGEVLIAPVRRATTAGQRTVPLVAVGDDGRALDRRLARFDDGVDETTARFDMPIEARNRVREIRIDGDTTAGGVVLLDDRWRRRPVGIVTPEGIAADQPLLSGSYYLERALMPVTEIHRGGLDELLDRDMAVIVLIDPGTMEPAEHEALIAWMDDGGVVVTFAGPTLAGTGLAVDRERAIDALLPVNLRRGGRSIGGAMSWREPASVASFAEESPFAGLPVPNDVVVRRQVLAQPSMALDQRTWARLTDDTPLVTANARGNGWSVLFHVTANAEWSSLPLSGLFVGMMERIIGLSRGVGTTAVDARLDPQEALDGFGRLGPAPAGTLPLQAAAIDATAVSPRHPPGFYGNDTVRRALNLTSTLGSLAAAGSLPQGIDRTVYSMRGEVALAPWLLAAALVLVLADVLASLYLRGQLVPRRHAGAALALGALLLSGAAGPAAAQDDGPSIAEMVNTTRLAYVKTGISEVDATSRAGLAGLGSMLTRRTSVEPGNPVGVDPEGDDLAFYPLIYWPVGEDTPVPSARAASNINRFLANGGTILFDSRAPGGAGGAGQLRRLAQVLDIPRLAPVPDDHVLKRSFYLLDSFPGRWTGGQVWVVPAEAHVNDGVSPVIAGSNDWAAAWAMDGAGMPLYPVVPGGEQQRETAFRFGINVVMYVLTGNYKDDQVHLPAIMERLGQ